MKDFEIKNRWNGVLIFEAKDVLTMKVCVELAIKNKVDLSGADLSDADLNNANF